VGVAIVTGSAGLIGSEAATAFAALGMDVVGIDNDMRRTFFGDGASTAWMRAQLEQQLGAHYTHHDVDVRDAAAVDAVFGHASGAVEVVVHTAAQPSHDWAAREPLTDFGVNAVGTLNVLDACRRHAPEAPFIFTSTNKVYGDRPNELPLIELDTRWEIEPGHRYGQGIAEDMSIDATLHSVFGASKVAADVMVQEYGRYFGMRTACFRGGTLTGPQHAATELHGFLGYVMRCAMSGTPYTVYGYKGKQVRDAIHCSDLVRAFVEFWREPGSADVFNIGGGRSSNCSVIEAIALAEEISGRPMTWSYEEGNRVGDHIWWIGDNGRFAARYPGWSLTYDVPAIMREMFEANRERWAATTPP
jgi:CDP-paratose 2-epimerase